MPSSAANIIKPEAIVLKKEFRDAFKIMLQSLAILLLTPAAAVLKWNLSTGQWEFSGLGKPFFITAVVIFAAYSGITIFRAEKKDRAFEYLFSLPVSRWKVLAMKVLPRLAILIVMMAAGGIMGIFTDLPADMISVCILFLTAICVSLAGDSLFSNFIAVFLLNYVLYYTSLVLGFVTMKYQLFGSAKPLFWLSQLLPAALLLIPMAAAFILTYKNFDAKPLKWQIKPYLYLGVPTVLALASFILVFLKGYLRWIGF
jgi:ABC-type transport system involved in multi-copper enzyme maturation permease subunit